MAVRFRYHMENSFPLERQAWTDKHGNYALEDLPAAGTYDPPNPNAPDGYPNLQGEVGLRAEDLKPGSPLLSSRRLSNSDRGTRWSRIWLWNRERF